MTICYFGADLFWSELQDYGFRRRNTCLLKSFAETDEVERIYVVRKVARGTLIRMWKDGRRRWEERKGKVVDVPLAPLLPERRLLPGTALVNRWLLPLQFWLQAGRQVPEQTVVWSYWPDGYNLARELRLPGLWVFDADHNIVDDVNESAGKHKEVRTLLADVIKGAELAVAGSRTMLAYFSRNKMPHSAYLRNGVDISRFTDIQADEKPKPVARPLRIGYLGSISKWLECGLLLELIGQHPEWQFIIAGPRYGADLLLGIEQRANVVCLGEIASKDVPSLLATFDVALGLYRPEPWLDVDSMKIFEYLAAGVPVVSTPFHPHLQHDFGGLLQIASNTVQFAESIKLVSNWDEVAIRDWELRRKVFLRDNSWSRRGQEALALVRTAFARRTSVKRVQP